MDARFVWILVVITCLAACATLPPDVDVPRTRSFALIDPGQTRLGHRLENPAQAHQGESGFRLLRAGLAGFLTRVQMADAAQRTLDVQYYLFRDDDSGQLLIRSMLKAADRGVRVRLLLDDFDSSAWQRQLMALDAHPNIEVRLFNPWRYRGSMALFKLIEFLGNDRLDYRMHNKLFVADNAVAIIGGRNIGDEYFGANHRFAFDDSDLFVGGPVIEKLSSAFDDFWNSRLAVPAAALNAPASAADLDAYRAELEAHWRDMQSSAFVRRLASGEPLASLLSGRAPLVWARAKVLYDSPDKARVENEDDEGSLISRQLVPVTASVKSELLIVSPYFVPGKKRLALLRQLRDRQVRIRVVTNSLESTDVVATHAAYAAYRKHLLQEGVELYETRPQLAQPPFHHRPALELRSASRYALHAKVLVFDRRKVFIGSMNVDRRSLRLNTEIGLLIDSAELAEQVASQVESIARPANSYVVQLDADGDLVWHTEEDGRLVDYRHEPATNAWQRLEVAFFSLWPLADEL